MNDTNKTNTIRIMLDHNIGISNYSNYKNVLKNKTSNWSRYKDKYIIDIIDEKTIFSIMKLESKPNKTTTLVKPKIQVPYYYANSVYILNGKGTNERGYWIKDIYDENYSYSIDIDGFNRITSISIELGIRPVLNIKKSLLKYDSGLTNITDIISKGTKIHIKRDTTLYDGIMYGGLQGMTVTNDKLIFMSANNSNPNKGVMNSYKINDFDNPYKKDYSNTGHGNGMTYNPKTNKIFVLVHPVNKSVYEYNGETLVREKEYDSSSFPFYTAIGYDYKNDLFMGWNSGRISLFDLKNNKKLFQYSTFWFEISQDLEYYNDYIFACYSDFGVDFVYQSYSFYKGYQIIYVYNAKLDNNKNPTKNFGRLIARLSMIGFGELESISFRNGYVYIGFGTNGVDFYKIDINKFSKNINKIS